MNPCYRPESASLSHAKLRTAFWLPFTYNSAARPVTSWKWPSNAIYTLSIWTRLSRVSDGCHSCSAIRSSPTARIDQSISPSPDAIGWSFAVDVIKRSRQLIFVLCENVTSYTSSVSLEDERHQTLRDVIVKLCLELRPMDGPSAVIRTDPALALRLSLTTLS